jgi:hypothetical protein
VCLWIGAGVFGVCFNYKALACFHLFHFFVFFPNNFAEVCVCVYVRVCEVCRIMYINLHDGLCLCVCTCVKCA